MRRRRRKLGPELEIGGHVMPEGTKKNENPKIERWEERSICTLGSKRAVSPLIAVINGKSDFADFFSRAAY